MYKLYVKLEECEQLSVDCLENCLKKHRICKPIGFYNNTEAKKYFEQIDKTEETYTYPELDEIIKNEKEKEENKRLQKQYGRTKGLVAFFGNMSQSAKQSAPLKK